MTLISIGVVVFFGFFFCFLQDISFNIALSSPSNTEFDKSTHIPKTNFDNFPILQKNYYKSDKK